MQVSYVSSSSTFTTHPCPMERLRLASSDVMLLCGLTNAPSANPDTMLGELCGRMGEEGGVLQCLLSLIPVNSCT